MAATAAIKKRMQAGDLQIRVVDVTLDNAYPTGGWALTPQQLGLGLNGVVWFMLLPEINGYALEWNYVANKLLAKQGGAAVSSPAAELANNAAVLNAAVVRVMVFGQGAG